MSTCARLRVAGANRLEIALLRATITVPFGSQTAYASCGHTPQSRLTRQLAYNQLDTFPLHAVLCNLVFRRALAMDKLEWQRDLSVGVVIDT
jgi:hypothetical protein